MWRGDMRSRVEAGKRISEGVVHGEDCKTVE